MINLLKGTTYYYEQGEYTIEIKYKKDEDIKKTITEFWIQKERYGTKLFMLGEIGEIKKTKKTRIIENCIEEWIEDYEFQINTTEEALSKYFERRNKNEKNIINN